MESTGPIYILYHSPCPDGFGAAFAAWKKFGDSAKYVPCSYGKPVPEVPAGAEVYMIDISFSRSEMIVLSKKVKSLVVLDHHVTAEKELQGLDFAIFDMQRSGTGLSWDYFHPGTKRPWIINYIEDRDLWRHQLPHTHEIAAAVQTYAYDFKVWDDNLMQGTFAEILLEGVVALRVVKKACQEVAKTARMIQFPGCDALVPVVNTQSFISDVCEELRQAHPEAPFVACYYDSGSGQRKWSLRSGPGFNVEVIAKQFSGGGHKTASGFVEAYPEQHIKCSTSETLFKQGSRS